MAWKIVGLIIAALSTSATSAQPLTVPHVLCAKSDSWTRPSADVQSKIWNDNRYKDHWFTSYVWTHDFIWNGADSGSITYHKDDLRFRIIRNRITHAGTTYRTSGT